MNGNDPLAQLRDIHLPPEVGWWPPAPGWWLLLLLLLAALVGLPWLLRRYRRGSYRRAARRELQALRENRQGLSDRQRLAAVAALLRRVALASCGRERVAGLSGAAWLAFLDRSGRTSQFSNGAGRVLGTDLYRPEVAVELGPLLALVEEWIRRHRPC
jgi:hypothetical protein